MSALGQKKGMKLYDISQEVFSSEVWQGDPAPQKQTLLRIADGAVCNLSAFSMCAHNGTHVDAPYHFLEDGCKIEEIPLSKTVGLAYVCEHEGVLRREDAERVLSCAVAADPEAARRILIKGNAEVSLEAADVFADAGVYLVGNHSQTVGPVSAPRAVHERLLGVGAVLLEGIRLQGVPCGVYLLCAAPLLLAGAEGAPCRAVLIGQEDAE